MCGNTNWEWMKHSHLVPESFLTNILLDHHRSSHFTDIDVDLTVIMNLPGNCLPQVSVYAANLEPVVARNNTRNMEDISTHDMCHTQN